MFAERRVEIGVGLVGDAGRRLDALLRPVGLVAAGEVAELELLPQAERVGVQARRAARAERQLVDIEVEQVAALIVQALQRLLDVEQEPGEVLEEAHVALDEKTCCVKIMSPGWVSTSAAIE